MQDPENEIPPPNEIVPWFPPNEVLVVEEPPAIVPEFLAIPEVVPVKRSPWRALKRRMRRWWLGSRTRYLFRCCEVDNTLEVLEFHERVHREIRAELYQTHYQSVHHDNNIATVVHELNRHVPIIPTGQLDGEGEILQDMQPEIRRFAVLPRFVAQFVLYARIQLPGLQDSAADRLILEQWLRLQFARRSIRDGVAARHMPYIVEAFFDPDSVGAVQNTIRRLPRWMRESIDAGPVDGRML